MLDINVSELLRVTLRAIMSMFTLFFVTKMLGKKQVSQMSLFDYVVGISIGNFAAEMTINLESHFLNGTLAVILFGIVAYIVSVGTMKSIKMRRYFMGVPTIVIQDGKLLYNNLKKIKFDINDLLQECRTAGYFDIADIEYALMETNGRISILPKSENNPVTIKDMNLKSKKANLVGCLIIDGKVMINNLKNMNKTESWLENIIKVRGYSKEEILLLTYDFETINIYERNKDTKPLNVLE